MRGPIAFGGLTNAGGRMTRHITIGTDVVGVLERLHAGGWVVKLDFVLLDPIEFPASALLGGTTVGDVEEVRDVLEADLSR